MKTRIIVTLIFTGLLLFASCGHQATEPHSDPIFSQPYPADGATDIPTTAELVWQSALGPASGANYKLFISTIPDPENLTQPQTNQSPGGLLPGHTYYWRVRANLPNGRTYVSPMWHFRTAERYQYPLELNTGWRYKVRFFFTDIETYGTGTVPTDTIEYATYVVVSALETIPWSSQSVYKLIETTHYTEQPGTDTTIGWFNNEPVGFYEFGYEAGSFGLSLPRKLATDHGWQIDPAFATFFRTSAIVTPGVSASNAEPIWDPFRSLAYPLRVGMTWEPSGRSDQLHITKGVIGRSRVETSDHDYLCWTVRWYYEGIDNLSLIDQFGEPGLVSRTTTATGVRLTSVDYPEGYATATIVQEIELDYRFHLEELGLDPDDFHDGDR